MGRRTLGLPRLSRQFPAKPRKFRERLAIIALACCPPWRHSGRIFLVLGSSAPAAALNLTHTGAEHRLCARRLVFWMSLWLWLCNKESAG